MDKEQIHVLVEHMFLTEILQGAERPIVETDLKPGKATFTYLTPIGKFSLVLTHAKD